MTKKVLFTINAPVTVFADAWCVCLRLNVTDAACEVFSEEEVVNNPEWPDVERAVARQVGPDPGDAQDDEDDE